MTFNEAINVHLANVDMTTGETISHREKFTRAINLLGGLDAIIPLIPFTSEEIQEMIRKDVNLNFSMDKWNAASGFIPGKLSNVRFVGSPLWNLYSKAKITSASCSEGVCLLKEAARQWAERNH